MVVKLECTFCKEKFEVPEDLFSVFTWPKCSCGKPLIILGETVGLSNPTITDRKPMVSSRSSSKSNKR